jgi:hypothetical protein
MEKSRVGLLWVLRLFGCVGLLALVPAVMPYGWMDALHRAAGLGPLPDAPIVRYLTRTSSALYAFIGLVTLLASLDLARYAALIRLLGAACLLFGPFVFVVDTVAAMPPAWRLVEGPWVTLYGVVILTLASRCRLAASWPPASAPPEARG